MQLFLPKRAGLAFYINKTLFLEAPLTTLHLDFYLPETYIQWSLKHLLII